MNDRNPRQLLEFAERLIDETDRILERHFAGEVAATQKADSSLVTAADLDVEAFLRSRIADAFPGHGIIGEEQGAESPAASARWIIDPLDGTHNFVRGVPVFATLLALERDGQLVLGVVSAPALGSRWSAATGHGAMARRGAQLRPVRVSSVNRLDRAQLCFSTVRGLADAGLFGGWSELVKQSWRDRAFGDFWGHVLVAQGSAEAMLEYGVNPWDLAAPAAILREAGGTMTDLSGRPSWSGPGVLSSNGLLHGRLLESLQGS